MSKYMKFERPEFKRPYEVHPIWRGIGCILLLIIPALSILGGIELVNYGVKEGWPIAAELLGNPYVSPILFRIPLIGVIARTIANTTNLYAYIVFSLVLLIGITGLVSLFYAVIYRMFGPPRFTRVDAPPSKYKPRSYKR